MEKHAYDVLIAGAGPAGTAAAIKLRQANLKVCLLDNVNELQLKVGESLPGAAIRLLNSLGVESMQQLLAEQEFSPCSANASAWGNNYWTHNTAILNPEGGGWHILRNRFDAALRNKACQVGVDYYPGKLGKITSSDIDGFTIGFKSKSKNLPKALNSKWLIDATGRANAIAKQFNVRRKHFEKQMAAIAWLKTHDKDLDNTTRIKSVEQGWWYSSRLPNNTRVLSFHGLADTISKMVKDSNYFISELQKTDLLPYPLLEENLLEGISATNASVSMAEQTTGKNWVAVGDAALSFDPLSSQGIFFALYSGIRGAEAITQAITSPSSVSTNMLKYKSKIEAVFYANQKSRKYHYTSELRFIDHPYWKQYFN